MSDSPKESWGSGGAYERWVGRWSRLIAEEYIDWLAVPPGRTWGDVGCGTGALVECILAKSNPAGVLGIDRSDAYVSEARNRVMDARARFEVGDACALTWAAATCDVTVSGLVLNFVPDPDAMTARAWAVQGTVPHHAASDRTRPGGRRPPECPGDH